MKWLPKLSGTGSVHAVLPESKRWGLFIKLIENPRTSQRKARAWVIEKSVTHREPLLRCVTDFSTENTASRCKGEVRQELWQGQNYLPSVTS